MRLVQKPEFDPAAYCAFTLKEEDPDGFFDSELVLPVIEPRPYIAVSTVKQLAAEAGMFSAEYVEQADADLDAALAEVEELTEERDALADQLQAVHVLRKAGYKPEQKRGPKARAA